MLSIAMIVKDEAETLPECLASVAGLAGEVCLVDTGSSDGTAALAESLGARVRHFAWCDDFAAARNASLAMCTGDWILVLDADERIAKEDHAALRAHMAGPRTRAYRMVTRNYTNNAGQSGFVPCAPDEPLAGGFAGWFPSTKVRLFPNGTGARFEGAVHELINPGLARAGLVLETSPVPVHHHGLAKPAAALRAKAELYLRLGHAKAQARPGDPQPEAELGNQYADLGDYTRAAAHYRRALQFAPASPELLKDLGGVLHLLGRADEAEKALRLAIKLEPSHVEAHRNLAVVLAARGARAEAIEALERALALAPGRADLAGGLDALRTDR